MSSDNLLVSSADFTRNWKPPSIEERSERWGGWFLEHRTLHYPAYPGGCYPIKMKTSATPECVAGVVWALRDLFHPQGCLCGCGTDMRLTAAQIRNKVPAKRRTPAHQGGDASDRTWDTIGH